jgi:hypothetical protein
VQRALKNGVESRNYRSHELRDLMEYRNATNYELLLQDQTKLHFTTKKPEARNC